MTRGHTRAADALWWCVGRMFSALAEPRGACDAQTYRTGAWRHTPNASAPYRLEREFDRNPFVKGWKYAYRSFWGLCDLNLPRNESRRSTQYAWQPDGCNLRPFSAPRFCSQFVRPGVQRELVLAGDSFTGQLFISLLAMLGGTFVREYMPSGRTILHGGAYVHDIPTQEFHVDALACVESAPYDGLKQWWANSKGGPSGIHPVKRPPLPIKFFRNEFLISNTVEPRTQWRHEYPWLPAVRPNTIVVLQVCGWFHSNYKGFQKNMLTAFNESAKRIGGPDWGKQIVVVSSNIGHEDCHKITQSGEWPLSKAVNYSGEPHRYGWNNIHMLNSMAEQMVTEIGGTFIDITTMLSYRPDGHIEADCGHWCLPGAYDIAATLLYNAALGRLGGPLGQILGRPQRSNQRPGAKGKGRGRAGVGRHLKGKLSPASATNSKGRGGGKRRGT